VRSVFIVDHNKKLRLSLTYPASTGRNFDELLRVIDSLQLTDHYKVVSSNHVLDLFCFWIFGTCSNTFGLRPKVATPVNWKHGEDVVIVPSLSNEAATPLFPKGWKEVKPYLRLTPQPNIWTIDPSQQQQQQQQQSQSRSQSTTTAVTTILCSFTHLPRLPFWLWSFFNCPTST